MPLPDLLEKTLNDLQQQWRESSPQFGLLEVVCSNYEDDEGQQYTDDVGIVTGLFFSDGQSGFAPGWWYCVTWWSMSSNPDLPIPFTNHVFEADLLPNNSKAIAVQTNHDRRFVPTPKEHPHHASTNGNI